MIDEEYLKKLKEEDYIAWDSLVNDPMITGSGGDDGCILPILLLIVIVGFTAYYFLNAP
tara:strand:- start:1028 stop:1204 length:177 start_codon:yes stop_codon:yes gene_type:complete